jgi:guanylate kinase
VRTSAVPVITIFVMPPSFGVLEQRLRGRSKDSDGAIRRRLQVARDEVASFVDYDYLVLNDELTSAVDRLRSIVLAERARIDRMRSVALDVVQTFATGNWTGNSELG